MSVAVEIWRALEAWDAARHPRGPGGRFIKGGGGGGGSDKPSLADAIRGTAAGGPKRQRDGKNGMSVSAAERAAARRSDTTGRPTQRTPAEHRAEGAHDVADEVERALADQGVPESQRKAIADRARAAADAHGERAKQQRAPSTKLEDQATYDLEGWLHHFGTEHRRSGAVMRELDRRRGRDGKPAPAVIPVTPTAMAPSVPVAPAASGVDVARGKIDAAKTSVRRAVDKLAPNGGSVRLSAVRNELGEQHNRWDVDAALDDMFLDDGVTIGSESNQKTLTQADRDAAVRIGGQDQHQIQIRPLADAAPPSASVPAPKTSAPKPAATPAASAGPRRQGLDGLMDALASIPRANERSTGGREPLVETIRRAQTDLDAGTITPREAAGRLEKLSVRYGTVTDPTNDAISAAIGDASVHLRSLAPPPKAKRAPARMDGDRLAEIEGQLASATSMDQAREHLAGMTANQLRQVASFARVYVTSADPKDILIGRIVNHAVGRRLDAAAIDRMTRR